MSTASGILAATRATPSTSRRWKSSKGPSSFLGGRGSTGGAINLVTKQPLATTFYAGSVSGGTDSYKRLTVDVNQSLDNVGDGSGIKAAAFRINAVGFDADHPGRDLVSNSAGASMRI